VTTDRPADLARAYAVPAVALTYDALDEDTISATLDVLYDTLAVSLGGLTAPGVDEARRALAVWGEGRTSVWGGFGSGPAPLAVIANAGALHALDYDDTDDAVPLHANSVLLPVLIADVEENRPDLRGHAFLTALAAGIDGAMRVGRAGGPKGSRGWNYSVISGGMGSVLGVAALRGWDVDTTVSALGHQLAQTSGSLQSIIDGTLSKRFQPAMVAKDVVISAALAQAGIDGPRNVFEGRAGFINLYQDGALDADTLVRGADSASLVVDLSIKPYPACRFTHACIDVALRMRQAGVDPETVERVTYGVSGQAVNMVGRDFDPARANVVDAQFSIAYTASVALHRGEVLIGDFDPDAFRASAAGAFARDRIAIETDPDVDFLAMAPVRARVRYRDGHEEEFVGTTVSGSPQARLTQEQLKAKATDCLSRGGSRVSADELWDAVRALADDAPLTGVIELLQRQGGRE